MRKNAKNIMDFAALGVTTSIGASAVTGAGGNAAGLANVSSQFGTMGTVMGAGMTMDMARGLMPKRKRR